MRDVMRRFWSRVYPEPNSGCWLWGGTETNDKDGYGRIWIGGRGPGARPVLAHRFSYERFVGPIPGDLFVCHRCDTRDARRASDARLKGLTPMEESA